MNLCNTQMTVMFKVKTSKKKPLKEKRDEEGEVWSVMELWAASEKMWESYK